MRIIWTRAAFTAVLAAAAAPAWLSSQHTGLSPGVHAGYNLSDLNELVAGGHMIVYLPKRLALYPGVTYYFVENGSLWDAHVTLRWVPARASRIAPYIGAGLYWSRSSTGSASATDVGLVGQVGAELLPGSWQPFAELQLLKDGAVSAQVLGGVRVVLRH